MWLFSSILSHCLQKLFKWIPDLSELFLIMESCLVIDICEDMKAESLTLHLGDCSSTLTLFTIYSYEFELSSGVISLCQHSFIFPHTFVLLLSNILLIFYMYIPININICLHMYM